MSSYRTLSVSREGSVAAVALDRPKARNSLNAELIGELTDCMMELGDDNSVRVITLEGKGGFFSAGADIDYMRQTADLSYKENLEDAAKLARLFRTIDECPKPVVANIRGAAIGGGMGLAAIADVAVAEEGTVFAFSEVRLGLSPATIGPFVLRKIGHSNARALFLTGERFGAERAREIGLVHEVAKEGDTETTVREKVAQLLLGGPNALSAAKGLLQELGHTERKEEDRITARRISELRVSKEGQEGLASFLEKRSPQWAV